MLDSRIVPDTTEVSPAHLLIHAGAEAGPTVASLESTLHRLRARLAAVGLPDVRAPLKLRVEDLQGRRLHTVDDAASVTVVSLPAGTYHVTAILGDLRRSYTLTLAQGAMLDLYLRLPARRW